MGLVENMPALRESVKVETGDSGDSGDLNCIELRLLLGRSCKHVQQDLANVAAASVKHSSIANIQMKDCTAVCLLVVGLHTLLDILKLPG